MGTWRKAGAELGQGENLAILPHNGVAQGGISPTSCTRCLLRARKLDWKEQVWIVLTNKADVSELKDDDVMQKNIAPATF